MRLPAVPWTRGWLVVARFVGPADRAAIDTWLSTLAPLWEQRYSATRPPPPGDAQRPLLRPVYWLGNWQFACLGYYEPPKRLRDVAVRAEPFPPVVKRLVDTIESRVRRTFDKADVPRDWRLNTCLVNFYGDAKVGDKWVDRARVGEHRDFEPGPVASLSFGERALFQLLPRGRDAKPVRTVWLEDNMLQAFAGPLWKDALLHRVTRVEDKKGLDLPPAIEGFRTRRVNLTLRYVPDADVMPFAQLSPGPQEDVRGYVQTLAKSSPFWAEEAASITVPPGASAPS